MTLNMPGKTIGRLVIIKSLTCEKDESEDPVKSNEVFECQSSGCENSIEEARKLMKEDKADVTGSSLFTDKTNEINKLLMIAREATDEGNFERAASYYDDVQKIDPDNCEACFYRTYWASMNEKDIDIPNNLKIIANSAENILKESLSCEPINKKACLQILYRFNEVVPSFIVKYIDLYKENPEWIQTDRDQYGLETDNFVHNKGNYLCLINNVGNVIRCVIHCFLNIYHDYYDDGPSFLFGLIWRNLQTIDHLWNSLPKNPFAGTELKYQEEYKAIQDSKSDFYRQFPDIVQLFDEECRSAEQRERKVQKKKNEAYWAVHFEEKEQLETRKTSFKKEMDDINDEINKIERQKRNLIDRLYLEVPSQIESAQISSKIKQLRDEIEKPGLFRNRKKNALKGQIDILLSDMKLLEKRANLERDEVKKVVSSEITCINVKLKSLNERKVKVKKQINEIDKELNKDHDLIFRNQQL